MATTLLLGPITFQDFELPERIGWGGCQRLAVHDMPGGTRVVDVLGRADGPIVWRGTFSGPDAPTRARMLDLMRADATVWPLVWDEFFYSVIIGAFHADYARPNWVPYTISCTVVRDETAAAADIMTSETAVLADATAAQGSASGMDMSGVLTALAASGATTPGTSAYAAALQAIASARTTMDGQVTSQDEALSTLTIRSAGDLTAAGTSTMGLSTSVAARAYLRRAQSNLQGAGG